jgi:Domain of unknown function (DUF4347)/SdrD B-like domain/Bacterial Ig domain
LRASEKGSSDQQIHTQKQKRRRNRRTIGFMPLEPRIMYDGAAAASAAVAHHHADHHDVSGPQAGGSIGGAPASAPAAPPATNGDWHTHWSGEQGKIGNIANDGTAPGNGMAPVVPSITSQPITQVVFVDSQVPDAQDLINGVKPGVAVFEINPGSDGLQQIANILAANNFTNLTAIDIVGHGEQGEFTVGGTNLTDGSIASEATYLSAIGKSLVPGGDLMLYGCDVAQGAAGQQFIDDLSAATGGANVAASTQDIGTIAGTNGTFENWTLDASTGTIDASTPFTQAAMDSYEGLLANTTVTVSAISTTLTTDADGDKGISPGDTVTSSITISNTTSTAATGLTLSETLSGLTETGNVVITPLAINDTYTMTGNTPEFFDAAHGVLANDIDFNGQALSVDTTKGVSNVTGGTVTLNADGSFTFTPTTGFSGTASFDYFVKDTAAGDSDQAATATITVTAPVWYVDSAASSSGADGSFAHPFQTIAAAATAAAGDISSGVNNTIFVENAGSTYSATSGITLAAGEQLLGDGSSLTSVNGNTVGLSSSNPTFSDSGSSADVTLSLGNTISGINITNTGSGGGIIDSSTSTGTTTMSNIAVSTGSGEGIELTHGGTVSITGDTNTISSSTGTALDVENTTISSSGITFKSISSGTGGSAANDGIILNNTGLSGGLTVTGDGSTAGSGGTIESKTGTTGGATNGDGIYLASTADVSLAYMQLNGLSYDGIYGQNVTNFSMDHTTVNGANGSAVAEGSVVFGSGQYAGHTTQINGVVGTFTITNSTISGGWYDNLDVFDWSGTADVTLANDTFNDNNAAHGNQNVYIDPDGSSVINATVTNSTWQGVAGGDDFYFDVTSTSPTGSNLSFTGNTVGDNLGGVSGDNGSGGFQALATGESGSATTFDIENNAFSGANGTEVGIANNENTGNASTTAVMNLIFNNNTIGAAAGTTNVGPDNSGSAAGVGLEVEPNGGTFNASITNNHIYEFASNGIDVTADVGFSTGNESGTANVEITGNTVADPNSNGVTIGALQDDIYIDGGGQNPGFSDTFVMNATVGGSTAAEKNTTPTLTTAQINNGDVDIFVSQDGAQAFNLTAENGSTTTFVSYNQDPQDGGGQVESFLSTYNTTPGGDVAFPGGSGFTGTDPSAEAPAIGPTFGTPSISGIDTEGDQLTASIIGSSTTFQWQESFSGSEYVDIFGANSSTYTLKESDVGAKIRVVETSTYTGGLIDTVASLATAAAVADNLTVGTPTISGTDTVGQILTASTVTADNSDATITYQWQRDGVNITSPSTADGQTYTLTTADAGHTIDVVATATDPHNGNVSETSGATATISTFTAPTSLASLTIGTLPGTSSVTAHSNTVDAITVSWEATINAQSNQLIVNPTYTNGSVTGTNFATVNVANATVGLDTLSLEGEIFNDVNANGLLDGGDSAISGVSVSVFVQGGSTALETTSTNGSGIYDFTGLAAGNYFVEVTAPTGFGNSSPVRDTTPNDYAGNKNYGLAISGGVVSTNAITIAYDQPEPTGATTYPGDDTTSTLDVGLTKNPVITNTGNTVDFYQGNSSIAVDSGLTLTDNGINVTGATVTISSGFLSGDTLNFTTQSGISGVYSGGTLTLSGSATAAQYQTALDSITYSFSGDPTNAGADKTRTVTWSVSDSNSQTSASGTTSTIDTFVVPVLAAGAGFTAPVMTTSGALAADSDLTVADVNTSGSAPVATVTISNGFDTGDTLSYNGGTAHTFTDGGQITGTFSAGTHALTLTGTAGTSAADFQAAFEAVQFNTTNTNSNNGTRTLTWVFNDDAGNHANSSNSLTTTINVEFPPTISNTGNTVEYYQGAAFGKTLDSAITVADPNVAVTSATVTISSGFLSGDTLSLNSGSTTVSPGDGSVITVSQSGNTLTLTTTTGTATAADYQGVLETVRYSFTGDPTNAGADKTRTVSWSVTDANNQTSAAGSNTTLDVFALPIVSAGAAGTPTETSTSGAVVADPTLSITDYNGTTIHNASVQITTGDVPSDTLTINGTTSGSINDGASGTITYSFTGSTIRARSNW